MTAVIALIRKQITESRWTLGLSALALFGLSWLFVFMTSRIEGEVRKLGITEGPGPSRFLQRFGGPDMDMSSAAIEVMFWNHPFIYLTIALWAISRATTAVSADIERGTLDMILSRPIARATYLSANVVFSALGLGILSAALIVGNLVATRYNTIADPPPVSVLASPAINLMALGFAMYGYTVVFSAMSSVRWRPILTGSVLTLAGFILHVAVNLPTLDEWKSLDRFSIFKAFNPVELVTKGETFAFNVGVLSGIGGSAILLAYLIFAFRDLPANS
jgi:ABC-2 type transport system permease protein